jgi:hypothetical protein
VTGVRALACQCSACRRARKLAVSKRGLSLIWGYLLTILLIKAGVIRSFDVASHGYPSMVASRMLRTGDDGQRNDLSLMLAAAGRTVESLPPDLQTAFAHGQISLNIMKRYLGLDSNWFTKIFMPLQGVNAGCVLKRSFLISDLSIYCEANTGDSQEVHISHDAKVVNQHSTHTTWSKPKLVAICLDSGQIIQNVGTCTNKHKDGAFGISVRVSSPNFRLSSILATCHLHGFILRAVCNQKNHLCSSNAWLVWCSIGSFGAISMNSCLDFSHVWMRCSCVFLPIDISTHSRVKGADSAVKSLSAG